MLLPLNHQLKMQTPMSACEKELVRADGAKNLHAVQVGADQLQQQHAGWAAAATTAAVATLRSMSRRHICTSIAAAVTVLTTHRLLMALM